MTVSREQLDDGIAELVMALQAAGLQTDWSCEGGEGHMLIRPTIQIRTWAFHCDGLMQERARVEQVMNERGHQHYWLSLMFSHGEFNTHGGEPVWLLELPGPREFLAQPGAYSPLFYASLLTDAEHERVIRKVRRDNDAEPQ